VAKVSPFDLFETRRFVGAAVGLVGLAITWRLARRLGGPLAGLLALLFLATCPLYYGHMFMNPKDAPVAVAMVFLLYALVRLFEEYPSPRATTVALFGLGVGLSIGSRILGGLGALYVIPPLAMLFAADWREGTTRHVFVNFGRFMLTILPGLVLAYAVMAVIWPWSVEAPLNPLRAVGYFAHFFEKPWKELYAGSLISVPDMPRSYVPMHFLLKLPELHIAFAIGGIVGLLVAAMRAQFSLRQRAIGVMLVMAATLPILIAVATRPAMYNGIRHFVFVVPPLMICAGLAGAFAIEHAARIAKPLAGVAIAILAAGFVDPSIEMVRLHPYQYAHFNHIAGGIEEADERFMLDYWGLAFKQASQALREKLAENHEMPPRGRQRWRIAVCGPHAPAEIALGPDFVTTWDPRGADFAMMLGTFYCRQLDAPVLADVEREDIIFARVYDIRGLNFTTLFTIPPVR
jgi:hypothetical protein